MPPRNYVLLLGAGFSRNWGGWLASEAFEYLIGCPEADTELKNILWRHKHDGGFESALADLQNQSAKDSNHVLSKLKNSIKRMFEDMDKAFGQVMFEFQNEIEFQIRPFLTRFNEIFTLNQDLLIERHYLNDNVCLMSSQRWDGWQIPGMKRRTSKPLLENSGLGTWEPDSDRFVVSERLQPYFKLHGSSNWTASGSDDLLVLGGNKHSIIDRYPVLKKYHQQFKSTLMKQNTRLMVIGYSFGDSHINRIIKDAVNGNHVGMFVIDPLGVDVIDKNRNAQIYKADALAEELWPHIIGSSRRTLREIFGSDRAEHGKVMRFFA